MSNDNSNSTTVVVEWALRLILTLACIIQSARSRHYGYVHGAKSYVLKVEDSIPKWLLPAVRVLRAVASVTLFSTNSTIPICVAVGIEGGTFDKRVTR